MTKIRTFNQFLKIYLFKPHTLITIFLYALCYTLVILLLINLKILINIFQNTPHFISKFWYSILFLRDYLLTLRPIDTSALVVIAVLFGANIQLVTIKAKNTVKQKNLRLTFGAGILSLVGTGCASCGFSILSVLGLGGVAAYLPFGGIELSFITIAILGASLYYNLQTLYSACKIPQK